MKTNVVGVQCQPILVLAVHVLIDMLFIIFATTVMARLTQMIYTNMTAKKFAVIAYWN
jgi:hypothetical protein